MSETSSETPRETLPVSTTSGTRRRQRVGEPMGQLLELGAASCRQATRNLDQLDALAVRGAGRKPRAASRPAR